MNRVTALAVLAMALCALAASAFQTTAPTFHVDPLWPKPLPDHWLLGSVTGVAVDARDHVWVVHRGYDSMTARTEIGAATTPKTADECCLPAPQVLEFDAAGTLLGHWGGAGDTFEWPVSPGGIAADSKGNVWIAAAGPPEIPGSANATAGRAGSAAGRAAAAGQGRGAASAGVRHQRQSRRDLGSAERQGLRLAGQSGRHRGRLERQRVDCRRPADAVDGARRPRRTRRRRRTRRCGRGAR